MGLSDLLEFQRMLRQDFLVFLDSQGVYYDANMGSLIVHQLNSNWEISKSDFQAAKELILKLVSNNISKYNFVAPSEICFDPDNKYENVVLVIDQRKDDQSVLGALADEVTFNRMFERGDK